MLTSAPAAISSTAMEMNWFPQAYNNAENLCWAMNSKSNIKEENSCGLKSNKIEHKTKIYIVGFFIEIDSNFEQ